MDGVEFDSVRGIVRIGDDTFEGKLIEGGQVEIAGRRLRPLALAEREVVIAAVDAAPDQLDECARLVAQLATTEGSAEPGSAAWATEAVALHLAGAAMTGALIVSSLAARRALGADADSLSVIEADRLANAIAPSHRRGALAGQENDRDDGWTTITYDDHREPGGRTSARPASVREIRDRFAAALLARANVPIPDDVTRWLLGDDEWAAAPERPVFPVQPARRAASAPVARSTDRSTAALDRWGDLVDPSPIAPTDEQDTVADRAPIGPLADTTTAPMPGASSIERGRGSGTAPAERAAPDAGSTAGAPQAPAGRRPPTLATATDGDRGHLADTGAHGPRGVAPAASTRTPTETSRWSRRPFGQPTSPTARCAASAFSDDTVGDPAATAGAPAFRSTVRPSAPADSAVASDSAALAPRALDAVDPDRLAAALHRAADARGLPR